ncbi:MAG: hypothetical protein AB8B60_16710 [Sulfitobacter sp.]
MPFLILFALSIIATYLTYKDASTRRMNAQGWAIFILLTSMIGLPFYLLARKPKAA